MSEAEIFDQEHKETFYMAGRPLVLVLTVPPHVEAGDFLTKVGAMRAAARAGDLETIQAVISPEFAADVFARWVSPAQPILTKRATIVTGKELYAIASPGLVMAVVSKLMHLASTTDDDAKGSASPSTSGSEGSEAQSTDSPAPSTANEASPASSTATETLAETA